MKIALSGSSGFIGKHLSEHLERLGYKVLKLDRSGKVPKCDFVVDLASYGNFHFQTDIREMYIANLARVLEIIENSKYVKGIILTSSSSVQLPVTTFYGASKLAMESMAKAFFDQQNKPTVVVRPATIIGVGEPEHHLIPTLINSCFTSKKMDFVSAPTHDFLDVEDFCEAIVTIIKNIDDFKGKVINVGTGKSLTNKEIKELVETEVGSKANLKEAANLRSYDFTDWKVKPSKELVKAGWKRVWKIKDSIKRMVTQAYLDRI